MITITMLFNNVAHDQHILTGWGLACLIEGRDKTILFDTGSDGRVLISNMKELWADEGLRDALAARGRDKVKQFSFDRVAGRLNDSYLDSARSCASDRSTAFQTAWALLGLMAAGEGDSEAVRRGVAFLIEIQEAGGGWSDPEFTAPGFPRVFYLRYHGYSMIFPLWALARYRNHVTAR